SQSLRDTASVALQPLLAGFPEPNGLDLGQGRAELRREFPVRSALNVGSGRVDVNASNRHRIFTRVNIGSSTGDALGGTLHLPDFSFQRIEATRTSTVTSGVTSSLSASGSVTNDVRVNDSVHRGTRDAKLASFAGAQPLPLAGLLPEDVSPR